MSSSNGQSGHLSRAPFVLVESAPLDASVRPPGVTACSDRVAPPSSVLTQCGGYVKDNNFIIIWERQEYENVFFFYVIEMEMKCLFIEINFICKYALHINRHALYFHKN